MERCNMKKENIIDKVLDVLEGYLAVIVGIVMIGVTLISVICRYVLNAPLTWGEEVARYFSIAFIYTGVAIAAKRKAHLGVEAFVSLVPKKYRGYVEWFSELLTIVILIFMSGCAIAMTVQYAQTGQITTVTHIAMALIFAMIPVSLVISVYHYIRNFMESLKKMKEEEV